jgi:hypothetical protein
MTYYRKDYSHIENTTGLRFEEGDTVKHIHLPHLTGEVYPPGRNRDWVYVRFGGNTYAEGCAPAHLEVVKRRADTDEVRQ